MINNKLKELLSAYKLQILLVFFFAHQIFYTLKIGTWWDEPFNHMAAKLTIAKVKFFIFGIKTNEYRYDFSDHEFFGMLYQLQVYFFTKLNFLHDLFNIGYFNNKEHFTFFLRHVYLAFYTVLGLYIIYLLLSKIDSDRLGFNYVLLLVFLPSINGYALFDDKDVPYALHLFIAFLLYLYFFKHFELNRKSNFGLIFLTGLSFGMLLLIRFNGIAFLIILLVSINLINYKNLINKDFIKANLMIGFLSLLTFVIGTVQGWNEYIKYLKNLYWQQFKVSTWSGTTIVNGEVFEKSGDSTYLLKMFFYKLPIPYLFMIFICIVLFKKFKNNYLFFSCLNFLILFSISYILFKPAAYSYERQYLFLFFFLNLIASFVLNLIKSEKIYKIVLFLFILFVTYTQYGLGEYKYTYLNEFVNEEEISIINDECFEKENCGNWSTDHLSVSGLEMLNMISNNKSPILSCAPFHTISIFNQSNQNINFNEKYSFKSGRNIADYTLYPDYVVSSKSDLQIYTNKGLFSDLLNRNSTNTFSILTEHHLTPKGNNCIDYLKQEGFKFKCDLVDEVYVKLRGKKVNISYLLNCKLN